MQAETNARSRISRLFSELIDNLKAPRAVLIGEHIPLGILGSKTPPIEVQHVREDGTVHSTFLTGVLDYICCSLKSWPGMLRRMEGQEALMRWKMHSMLLIIFLVFCSFRLTCLFQIQGNLCNGGISTGSATTWRADSSTLIEP